MSAPHGQPRARCPARTATGTRCRKPVAVEGQACRSHRDQQPAALATGTFGEDVAVLLAQAVRDSSPTRSIVTSQALIVDHAERHMTDITGAQDWRDWLGEGLGANSDALDQGELERLVAAGEQLVQARYATSTTQRYQRQFAAFQRWCHERLRVTALPASPQVVAAYLIVLAHHGTTALTTDGLSDGDDEAQPGALAPVTLGQAAAAIGATHRNHGHPDPTEHPRVRSLLGGYARTYARTKQQAHGVTLEELALIAVRAGMPPAVQQRDLTLLAIATHPLIEVSANQLGALWWPQVVLPDEAGLPAQLAFGGRRGSVWILPEPDPAICPVRQLLMLRTHASGNGPVLPSPQQPDRPMSRQGITQRVRQLVERAHLDPHQVIGELPRLGVAERQTLLTRLAAPSDSQVRDLALITLMWWAALRASEASALDVADLTVDGDDGLHVRVRTSKTDPYGEGAVSGVASQGDFLACPLRCMTAWLERYATILGRDLAPTDPLFPQLHRGTPGPRLGYDGVNDAVKRWAEAAGITPATHERISSHGLRAGQTTALLADGHSAEAIARHQRRKDTRHVLDYYRPESLWTHNPTRGLATPPTPSPAEPGSDDHVDDR